jgi:alginate O-acetyltransferase complex protein AlgI
MPASHRARPQASGLLFTSHSFIFAFVPLAVLLCYVVGRATGRDGAIVSVIVASLAFYSLTSQSKLAILVVSVLANHLLIRTWFATPERAAKKLLVTISVIGNLGALAYFKYANFFVEQLHQALGLDLAIARIALPLAISFFTFQQIAYTIEVHTGKVKQHSFLDYAFCVTFFPHLVAGPIVNYSELIPQLRRQQAFGFRQIDLIVGICVFLVGLAKKTLVADTFATFVAAGFDAADKGAHLTMITAWTSTLAYTFQIYFDFSGYSDMAIGLARIFGLRLPTNFASPYKSKSIIEFWRRWHITLSRFLRQYLYIPLGGNRKGRVRTYVNLLVTMLLGGLWHGANWTFVAWGGIHGAMLAVNHAWRELRGARGPQTQAQRIGATAFTFLCVVFAWTFFRAETIHGAWTMVKALVGIGAPLGLMPSNAPLFAILLFTALAIVFCLPNTQELFSRYKAAIPPAGPDLVAPPVVAWRPTTAWLVSMAVLGGVACFWQAEFPKFLYWGF